jgi:long-chain fatty acid transport protein
MLRWDLLLSRAHAVAVFAAASVAVSGTAATAGGFAVREQSTTLLGSAFAGSAAGGDLSSSFWNPAAFGIAQAGLSTQSSTTVILPDTEFSNGQTTILGFPSGLGGGASTSIDKVGVIGSSYGAYRLNDKMVLGLTVTSPFGLSSNADDQNWAGRYHGRAAEMLTVNATPTLAYEIAPGVQIAAGVQLEYMKLKLWSAAPVFTLPVQPSLSIKLEDSIGVGYTAGILINTGARSNIGLGFRSSIHHDLSGDFNTPPIGPFPAESSPASASFDTPEMLTLSAVQSLTPQIRAMATIEWTNWSRISRIPVQGVPDAVLDAKWKDGWFISGGGEYDYAPDITLRGGVAWEKSPVQSAPSLSALPDSDRLWLTMGGSYRYSQATTLDVSYAHVFFDDSRLRADTLVPSELILNADVTNSADIISFGVRTHW